MRTSRDSGRSRHRRHGHARAARRRAAARRRLWRLVACAERPDPVEPCATSWLLDRAGTYLRSRGEPAAARPLLERALSIHEAAYGPEHPTVPALRRLLRV